MAQCDLFTSVHLREAGEEATSVGDRGRRVLTTELPGSMGASLSEREKDMNQTQPRLPATVAHPTSVRQDLKCPRPRNQTPEGLGKGHPSLSI